MSETGVDLIGLMILDPIGAYLAVEEALRRASEDLRNAEDMAATMSKVLKVVSDQLADTQRDLAHADKAAEAFERERNEALEHMRLMLSTMGRVEGCNCSECDIRREAETFLKSFKAKLESDEDGG